MADTVSKSWFCVFNNPADNGYEGEPEQVCERLRDEWIGDSDTRSGAWAYCISASGLHHIHMVICDSKTMRFSAIKSTYAVGMHFEATKGTKSQAEDYINKRGVFEEKGEEVVCMLTHGEIIGRQGRRTDLELYYSRLQSGDNPQDILNDTPKAYVHRNVLRSMYFDIRKKETPLVRPVKVYWHFGETGTGKSYERVKLSEELGAENIYYLTAFNTGSFDGYNGERVLWIEDFRGEFSLQEMLRYLDCYVADIPSRYVNVKGLWNEVHITSALTPRECYYDPYRSNQDRIEQLLRRITSLVYHFTYFDPYNTMVYSKLYFPSDSTLNYCLNEKNKYVDFMKEWVVLPDERD